MTPSHATALAADRYIKERSLLELARTLGAPEQRLAILGEGNVSARIDDDTFLVKASGGRLGALAESDLVPCRPEALVRLLAPNAPTPSEEAIEQLLLDCRINPVSKKPSVEAAFHAYLLTLPGVEYVGHTHPVTVNQIMCSPRAQQFADRRIFPDEVVCCGVASAFVPYVDPGLLLAREIKASCEEYAVAHGRAPRVILLENHGIITLGATPEAVTAAMAMATKAAEIFIGAAALGGPVFLSADDVRRIDRRLDEKHRRKALKLET